MSGMNRTSIIAAILVMLAMQYTTAYAAKPRTEIALFQYKGVVKGQEAEVKYQNFRGILDNKILNIRSEVLQGRSSEEASMVKDLHYLGEIHISSKEDDKFKKNEDVYKWLDNEPEVLFILRGIIMSDDNMNYAVYSNLYLRTVADEIPSRMLSLNMPIKSAEIANTKDSHTIAILYALAMDAKKNGMANNRISLLLRPAFNKLADIKRRKGKLPNELQILEKALLKAREEAIGVRNDR
jgi:hypothetical protein